MAVLFDKAKSTINEHIKNIYEELELEESSLMKKFAIFTQTSLRCISTSDQYKIRKENN